MNLPDVGIVVIGRNEGKRLSSCLESVRSQIEKIVYVDSGSVDGSIEVAKQAGATTISLDPARPFTAARARNEGFLALKSILPNLRFVQFIDGDCILDAGWIQAALAFIAARNEVAVVCGRRRERFPAASIYNRLIDREWNTPIGECSACGGDALIRAEAFEAVHGFTAFIVAGEEPDLCFRLRKKGWKIWRIDSEMTLHDAAIIYFGQWWNRAVRSGYGWAQLSDLHRESGAPVFRKDILRTIVWSALMPIIILCACLASPKALIAFLIYPAQVCRIALKQKGPSSDSWTYGLITVVSRFAELRGLLRYCRHSLTRVAPRLIEYK